MKISKRVDVYLKIEPTRYHFFQPNISKEMELDGIKEDCEEIMEEAIKHSIVNKKDISLIEERREECSVCGYEWETDSFGEPQCCEKAVEEWKEEKKEQK